MSTPSLTSHPPEELQSGTSAGRRGGGERVGDAKAFIKMRGTYVIAVAAAG